MAKVKGTNGNTAVAEKPEVEEKEEKQKAEKKEIKVISDATPKNKKRYVVYPEFRISRRFTGEKAGGLTEAEARVLLGWRDEKEAIGIEIAKNSKLKIDDVGYGDDFLFKDMNEEKVRCLANKFNRPHYPETSHKYCQDILNGNWAGPLMLPDILEEVYDPEKPPYKMSDGTIINPGDTISIVNGTVNGETIVIGRYGNVISGQHRLIGFIWACQMWRKESERYAKWPDQPVLECVVVTGCSEDPRVVRTIDNVLPRQFADVIYTSPIFADMKSVDKKECSVMAQKAVNLMWQRTIPDVLEVWQTHSESMNFVERHGGTKGRLMQFVRFLFALNKTHTFGTLKLSPGQCAGLLYLMGSSATDGEKYRSGNPPGEKLCNWSREDQAEEFFKGLVENIANEGEEPFALEAALKAIVDVSGEESARWTEKLVVLSRAWEHVVGGGELFVDDEDVFDKISLKEETDYAVNDKGEKRLVAISNFGGIDLGSKQPKKEDDPEEVEEKKTKTRQEKQKLIQDAAERLKAKVAAKESEGEEEPKSEVMKAQKQTRKRVEQDQHNRAAEADFLKTWTEWSREGKLVEEGGSVYREHFKEWVAAGRPDIREHLAELVREGKAQPGSEVEENGTSTETKPSAKIRVKGTASK